MPGSRAIIQTDQASRYLQQLCKHWAHKFETEFTPTQARIALPLGETRLAASDASLSIELTAYKRDDLEQFRQVVQSHIERFAFRETLQFEWLPDDGAGTGATPDP